MLSQLEKSILAALVYFDIFEYPLTLLEVHRFLLQVPFRAPGHSYTLGEVREAVFSSEALGKVVRFKNGFFYLRGREHKIRTRAERLLASISKYQRARRVTRLLSWVPYVRLVAVCNSLAYNNARLESDIDLIIITKKGGVWWARFFSLLILKLLRLRPGQGGWQDKICLSFFADEAHLNLSPLAMNDSDVNFINWLAAFYPLYSHKDYCAKLWRANGWLKNWLPNYQPVLPHPSRFKPKSSGLVKTVLELILAPFSKLPAFIQKKAFPAPIRKLINIDTRVRVEDGLLKFHTNDRREEYNRLFLERLASLSNSAF